MEVIRLVPGEPCPPADTGDVLLIKGTAAISKLIMLVQPFSHVVCVLDFPYCGDAQAHGVVRRSVRVYDDAPRVLVRIGASSEDREQISAFLESVLAQKWRYNYLGFMVSALMIVTGGKLSVRHYNTSYCSALAAECLVRTGMIFPKPPGSMTPGDLATFFGV